MPCRVECWRFKNREAGNSKKGCGSPFGSVGARHFLRRARATKADAFSRRSDQTRRGFGVFWRSGGAAHSLKFCLVCAPWTKKNFLICTKRSCRSDFPHSSRQKKPRPKIRLVHSHSAPVVPSSSARGRAGARVPSRFFIQNARFPFRIPTRSKICSWPPNRSNGDGIR